MTTDLLPDMNLPYALVITTDSGASPEEVETDVSAPIEAAMATTSNIKNVSSTSHNNYSVVILEYEQSTNMDSVLIEIQQKLDQIKGSWGDTVGSPMIMQLDPDMMPIMIAAADVDDMEQAEVTDYVTNQLIPSLESVEGVASVTASGTLEQEVQVTMDQDKIDKLNKKIQNKINDQFKEAQDKLDSSSSQIKDGQSKLESGEKELADKLSTSTNEIINNKLELTKKEQELATQLDKLKENKQLISTAIDALKKVNESAQNAPEELNAAIELLQGTIEASGITLTNSADIPTAIETLSQNLAQINTGISTIEAAQKQIATGKVSLDQAMETINQTQVKSVLQMSETSAKLAAAATKLEEGQQQLDSSKDTAKESADLNQVLTISNLTNILTAQNFSMPAGYAGSGDDQHLVRVGDKVKSVDELSDMVLVDLGMDGIKPIKLSDVANIELVDKDEDSYSKVNSNPAIMLSIEKQTGYSTGDVTKSLQKKFESLEKTNDKLNMSILMNQGIYIDIIVKSVLENMIVGAILAILVLLLFLKDIKPTLIIACSIPLSVVFAIVLMYFTNISLNIISLSGLALGIGMLVDNSIVVIENIYRLRKEGLSIRKASVEGASQVGGAIIASTITTVCVFAPIVFTEGITRQLFVDIALTIAFTLGASLLVALTFVPMMAAGILKNTKETKDGIFDYIKDWYAKVLKMSLKFKPAVFVLVIVLLGVSFKAALSKGFSFMDMNMSTNQITVTIGPNDGQDLSFEELSALSDEAMKRFEKVDGIETVGAMSGGGGTLASMSGGGGSSISMYLVLDEDTKRSSTEITKEVTEVTKDLDCKISADSSASDMSAFMGSGISIEVKGSDLDKLQEIAGKVAEITKNTEGTVNVEDGLDDTSKSFTIHVDKKKAAKYSMTVAQVFQSVYSEMASNKSATTVSTDIRDYDVYVQSEEQSDVTVEDIRDMKLSYKTREGKDKKIALSKIATFEEGTSLNSIARDAQTRYIQVTASIDEDHNVTLVSNEIQKELKNVELPEGYSIKMAGEDETINDAMSQLSLMLILAIVFIYLVMVAQFQSLLSPFIIMFTIPLAFTGGLFALYFTGNDVSVIAMIGFVMLAGIIVNNGIVMVDYINQLRREGMDKKEAIVEAGKTRLRPILMTALTTILSMSTMAIGLGSGSEMMQPMAIVTIGGLIYGTILTLIVVPCIYDLFQRNKSMVEEEL